MEEPSSSSVSVSVSGSSDGIEVSSEMMESLMMQILTKMDRSQRNEMFEKVMKELKDNNQPLEKKSDQKGVSLGVKKEKEREEEMRKVSKDKESDRSSTKERTKSPKAEMIVAEAPTRMTVEEPQAINVEDTASYRNLPTPSTSKDHGEEVKPRKPAESIIGIAHSPFPTPTTAKSVASSATPLAPPTPSALQPGGPLGMMGQGTMAMLPNGQMVFMPQSSLTLGYPHPTPFVPGTVAPQGSTPSAKLGTRVAPSPTKAGSSQNVPIQRVEHKVPALQMIPPLLPPSSQAGGVQHGDLLRRQHHHQLQQQLLHQLPPSYIGQTTPRTPHMMPTTSSNQAAMTAEAKLKLEHNLKEQQEIILARINDMYGGKATEKQIQDHIGGPLLSIEQNGQIFTLANPFYQRGHIGKPTSGQPKSEQTRSSHPSLNQLSSSRGMGQVPTPQVSSATATAFPQMVQPMSLAQTVGLGGLQMPQMVSQMVLPPQGLMPGSTGIGGFPQMSMSPQQYGVSTPSLPQYPMMTPHMQMQFMMAQQHSDRVGQTKGEAQRTQAPTSTAEIQMNESQSVPPQYIMVEPSSVGGGVEMDLLNRYTLSSLALPTKLHEDCQCYLQSPLYQHPDPAV